MAKCRQLATDPEGAAIIIEVHIDISSDRNGDWGVLYALTRAKRSSNTPVF
ncbi:hypothetical protein [Candidatus Poriferisodalis sp.]|uniref:hypothetical protein n=1 Tax=Candidatus Poriferisodalis sp. TaxID=3101277 RepID=UPI003B01436E